MRRTLPAKPEPPGPCNSADNERDGGLGDGSHEFKGFHQQSFPLAHPVGVCRDDRVAP